LKIIVVTVADPRNRSTEAGQKPVV